MVRRILLGLAVALVVLVAGAVAFVALRQNPRFDAPYPEIAVSMDASAVARGRYVVRSVANCASCHGDPTRRAGYAEGEEIPLRGGQVWDIPPGAFYARNLTPDLETGLGNVSDRAIARALRFGVGHDGRALLPFMELQGLSDEDLAAVVAYLRVQPPVRNAVPAHRFTLLGRVVKATALANPVGPAEAPPVVSPRGATLENGRYLAESVALCWACHTQRDPMTGALIGPRFGGATGFVEPGDPGRSWSPPNITGDPGTGRLGRMSEDAFVARFRAGRVISGSPMPWRGYARMAEEDLRAIYRYLKRVPPAKNDVGPPVVDIGKP